MQTKKLLGSTLALAMILPSASVNAELLKNLKLSGQLDLQGTSASNVTDFSYKNTTSPGPISKNDRIGDMQTRVMVSLDWDLLDDVHSKVTLAKNNRNWGNGGGNGGNGAGFGVANGHGNTQSEALTAGGLTGSVLVDQAYVKIDKVFGSVDTTLGRQFYGNSGDLIVYFGPSDKAWYGMPVNALDTARFDWANDTIGLTGIVGKTVGSATGVALTNTDLRGIVASLKAKENVSGAFSLYNRVTHNVGPQGLNPQNGAGVAVANGAGAGGKNDNLWVADLKGKLTMGGAWLGLEFAKNFGENRVGANATNPAFAAARSYIGWAGKLDGGVKADLNGLGAVTGWGQFAMGSGDGDANSSHNAAFTAINGDYRPGSIYGRFTAGGAAVLGGGFGAINGVGQPFGGNGTLTNRVIWGLGAKVTPSGLNKLTGGLSYWDYRFQTAGLPVVANANSTGLGNRSYAGNKHIGSEIDVDLEWKHSENVSFMTGVGRFYAGGSIKEAVQPTSGTSNAGTATGSQSGSSPASLAYFDVRVKF